MRLPGPQRLRDLRTRLAAVPLPTECFDPKQVAGCPESVRRWLTRAIATGTPLWRSVELTMRGQIKIGSWRPFTARQLLVPGSGFIWAATARVAGLPVAGFDRYSDGAGQMRWRLAGLVPVQSATGVDVTRSAAGRLAGESVAWVPTVVDASSWSAGPTAAAAAAGWQVGEYHGDVEIHVGDAGQLTELRMTRWGNPDNAGFADHMFGVTMHAERAFGGITMPSAIRAGWWWGTEQQEQGEFFRAEMLTPCSVDPAEQWRKRTHSLYPRLLPRTAAVVLTWPLLRHTCMGR